MKAQFKELRFKTDKEFKAWLNEQTYVIIELEDQGQDMQKIWVHKTGEILHCDFTAWAYNGKFIQITALHEGWALRVSPNSDGPWNVMKRLVVESFQIINQ